MPSAYQRPGRKFYYLEFIDQHGRKRSNVNSKISDRKTAENLVHQIETDAQRIKAGMPALLPEITGPFLGTSTSQHTTWEDATAAYLIELTRNGSTPSTSHYKDCRMMLARIRKDCPWPTITAIKPADFTRFLGRLAEAGRSPRTQNHYHAVLRAACNFWVRQAWLFKNPIADLQSVTVGQKGRRRFRRALTLPELDRLCAAASFRRQATVYRVAAFSGFRRIELCRLRREDCTPTGEHPRWHVPASRTKNGLPVDLPMTPECAEALRPLWLKLNPGAKLFHGVPDYTGFTRHRLKAKLPAQDERGRWADFHSLRYSFALFMSKLFPIEVVSKLMRHSNINLTIQVYMDLGLDRNGQDQWSLPRSTPAPSPTTSPTTLRIA
jgi:integrase